MGDVFVTMLAYRKFFPNCAWKAELDLPPSADYACTALYTHHMCPLKPLPLDCGGGVVFPLPGGASSRGAEPTPTADAASGGLDPNG
jgi:hypothetical protein